MSSQTIPRSSPLVSVCVPTYSGAEYLSKTIESVLCQTLSDFELLILDDCSPDNTKEVVSRYTDKRIRFVRNDTNLGPEGNWNRCLTLAQGTYFKLLPQDDTLFPDTLERQVRTLENNRHKDIAFVFGSRTIISADEKPLMTRGYPSKREGIIPAPEISRRCIQHGTNLIGEPGAVMFSRRLTEHVGFFDASFPYVIDLDYWFRLLAFGNGYYLGQEPVSTFRISRNAWSTEIGGNQSREMTGFVEKTRKWPHIHVTSFDVTRGALSAKINNILRLVFYKFVNNH